MAKRFVARDQRLVPADIKSEDIRSKTPRLLENQKIRQIIIKKKNLIETPKMKTKDKRKDLQELTFMIKKNITKKLLRIEI